MKKVVFLISLFISAVLQSQIVNIPDANFKAKLLASSTSTSCAYDINNNRLRVDSNGNGEIEVNEAIQVYRLDVSGSSIVDLTGLVSFTNLETLSCNDNQITSLNVSQNLNLKRLYCSKNQLTSLDVSLNVNLIQLFCDTNQITSLNVSQNVNLYGLLCNNNQITTLNLNQNLNLRQLYCHYNQITSLDVSQNLNLQELICNNNQITTLNLGNIVNLKQIYCGYNQLINLDVSQNTNLVDFQCGNNRLTNLDVSQNSNLRTFYCSNNQLINLDVSQNPNLDDFQCANNQLTNLDVSQKPNLITLYCSNNQLINLNASQNPNLIDFHCENNGLISLNVSQSSNLQTFICEKNQLTNLDVSQNLNLYNLQCGFNQLTRLDVSQNTDLNILECNNNILTNIFAKNGNLSWSYLDFSNNPNLRFVCIDDEDVTLARQKITQYGYTNCHANSYCSFTPGGNYNTITGLVKYDYENDGCSVSDISTKYLNVKINDGTNTGYTCIDSNDKYNFFTQTGTFTVSPQLEIPSYFTVSPAVATQTFVNSNNNIATHNFCLTANGVQPDVEVVVAPIVPARPGFEATYRLAYKNKGNQIITDGLITLSYDASRMTFLNASIVPVSVVPGFLTFDYSNLQPFENDAITINFNINSPVQTPAVNIGDILPLNATIVSSNGDVSPVDNVFEFRQEVVGAYDPNDITCLQGNDVSSSLIGDYLHYLVRFENTGNNPATNIVVETFVDSNEYQLETMQIINATHNLYSRTNGNTVKFIFEDIQLPAAVAGPGGGGGHGGILLKMRSSRNLIPGNKVSRKANIYFDYNAPVVTNDEDTVFSNLSVNSNLSASEYSIKPNPVVDNLEIKVSSGLQKIELFDVNGRLLQTHFDDVNETKIDMNRYANGVYFVKVYTSRGIGIQKIIKE